MTRRATLLLGAALAAARPSAGLMAAAAKVDITPDLKAETVLLAGYGPIGRRARGVHDPLYARLLVLRQGATTVALAAFDLLALERRDVEDLRRLAGYDAPGRFLFVGATHTHSGPDTVGLWGPLPGVSGADPAYLRRVSGAVAAELRRLETRLRPARVEGGRGALDPRGLCRDTRDPQVLDPDLAVLRVAGADGRRVATVVNWSCHPVVLGWDNRLVSADFPGPLCARVEEKAGGACLFFNGMIGGHLTADARAETFAEAARIGTTVADAALALKTAAGPARRLAYRAAVVRVPVENSRYLLFLPALARGHRLLGADGRPSPRGAWALALRHWLLGLDADARPWVDSEVSVVDVGPARLLGLPAEVFPELAIGGYDGRYAFGRPLIAPGTPDPPALARAPGPPYLRDLVRAPAPMLVGLAGDELGYLVPGYDFKTRANRWMLPRLPGHYEETNSIGPSATRILVAAAARLLEEAK